VDYFERTVDYFERTVDYFEQTVDYFMQAVDYLRAMDYALSMKTTHSEQNILFIGNALI
jgi:hypothetical protein